MNVIFDLNGRVTLQKNGLSCLKMFLFEKEIIEQVRFQERYFKSEIKMQI